MDKKYIEYTPKHTPKRTTIKINEELEPYNTIAIIEINGSEVSVTTENKFEASCHVEYFSNDIERA